MQNRKSESAKTVLQCSEPLAFQGESHLRLVPHCQGAFHGKLHGGWIKEITKMLLPPLNDIPVPVSRAKSEQLVEWDIFKSRRPNMKWKVVVFLRFLLGIDFRHQNMHSKTHYMFLYVSIISLFHCFFKCLRTALVSLMVILLWYQTLKLGELFCKLLLIGQ